MNTLFPSSDLDKKLSDATSPEPGLPSTSLLYELGRATHRDDDYRIITSQIWQTVLRSNQRPIIVLKTLMVLEAVLLHGPDRALEETVDMKTDIKALVTFSHSDEANVGKVREKAKDIIGLLEDGSRLQEKRTAAQSEFTDGSETSETRKPKKQPSSKFDAQFGDDDGFGAAFGASPAPAPAPAPAVDLFAFDAPAPAPAPAPVAAFAFDDMPEPAAPSLITNLSGNIGKISIKGRDRDDSEKKARSGSGVSLGALPTPALPAAPKAFGAPPAAAGLADIFGAPAAPMAMGGGGDIFGAAVPPAAQPLAFGGDDAFGDFGSAPAPAPPKSAMDALLENSLNLSAPPAPAPAKPKPMGMAAMGGGSGLAMGGAPMPPPMPMGGSMGGMPPMGGMGGMPPMGGMGGMPPMGGMGGMSQMGGMGGMPPMGGMGMGGMPPSGMAPSMFSAPAPAPAPAAPAADPFAGLKF